MQLFFSLFMFVLRLETTLSLALVFWFSVYGLRGKLEKATEMFTAAQELGLPIDEKIYTNMLNFYGKAGQSLLHRVKESKKITLFMFDEFFAPHSVQFLQGDIRRRLYYLVE